MPKDLTKRYRAGASVLELAVLADCSRTAVKAALVRKGVKLRTASEQQTIRMSRCTPEERKALAAAAHAAVRGRIQGLEEKTKRAITRMKIGKQSHKEMAWQVVLASNGVDTVAQFAVGIYNVDLAVPKKKIAFEVQGTWHSTESKKGQDTRKREALEAVGWRVVDLCDEQLLSPETKAAIRRALGRRSR